MFSNNCSDFYSVGVESVFCPRASTGKRFYIVLRVDFHCNYYVRTQINFTRVNKIEAMYGRSRVNV